MLQVVPIGSSADLSLSQISDNSPENHRAQAIQTELLRLLDQSRRKGAQLLRLDVNTSELFSNLQQLDLKQDRVLIVLEGKVALNGDRHSTPVPVGYPLAVDDLARQSSGRAITALEPTLLLSVPLSEFESWRVQSPHLSSLLAQVIQSVHPTTQMPPEARGLIQDIRGQNISTLIAQKAMTFINQKEGLLDIINPERVTFQVQGEIGKGRKTIGTVEQFWHLVEISSDALHRNNYTQVKELAEVARADAVRLFPGNETAAVRIAFALLEERLLNESKSFKAKLDQHVSSLFDEQKQDKTAQRKICNRLLEIHWLRSELRLHDYTFPQEVEEFKTRLTELIPAISSAGPKALLKELDAIYEDLFKQAREDQHASLLSIRIDKRPPVLSYVRPSGEVLPAQHENYGLLQDLARRLKQGQQSAVGGADYTKMRFPEEVLRSIAQGKTTPIFYDGSQENGIRFARRYFGANDTNPNLLEGCTIVRLEGQYGKFERTLIFFRSGASALVVSHTGASRQLSNAAAMLLYADPSGARVSPEQIVMARDAKPLEERIGEELERIIQNENEQVRGRTLHDVAIEPANIRNQLLMLLRPSQLEHIFNADVEIRKYSSEVLGEISFAYIKSFDGKLTRLLVPAVGSAGLYGEAAGEFVKAFYGCDLLNIKSRHVLFSATAGGLGLRDAAAVLGHGQDVVTIPQRGISYHTELLPIHTAIEQARIKLSRQHADILDSTLFEIGAVMKECGVIRSAFHFSIDVPALETYEMLDAIEQSGHGSIDCEGGPIAKALKQLDSVISGLSFTPLYLVSDFPLANRTDRSKSLAYGGAIHDVSYSNSVNKLLPRLLSLTAVLDTEEGNA